LNLTESKVEVHSPQHAQQIGISTVYQEINLCTNISVAENIMLGHEPKTWFGAIHWKKMNQLAEAGAQPAGNRYRCFAPVGQLLGRHPADGGDCPFAGIFLGKVLILDEPTSSLDVHETNQLFEVMRGLKSQGIGIVFITHFLDQVYQVPTASPCCATASWSAPLKPPRCRSVELIAKMFGRSLSDLDEMSKGKGKARNVRVSECVRAGSQGLGRKG
jgi:galactofuranose transport system ATP-binding protein